MSYNEAQTGLPGIRTARSATHRRVLLSEQGKVCVPGLLTINGTLSRDAGHTGYVHTLRPGKAMGKITATGLWAPSWIGLTGVLHDTSVVTTTMTLPAAVVTEIERRIGASGTFKIIGPPTSAGTVATETVTYSAIATATTITITATSADFAAGSIIAPTDGSESARLLIGDGYGIRCIDENGDSENQEWQQWGDALCGGFVDTSQIVDISSDTSVLAFQKAALATYGHWYFDDSFIS